MAYDYYCTGCGEKLNNNMVLFDMQKLLTRDERKFNILKFRITQDELLDLYGKEDGGWHHCILSLSDIAAYMSHSYNIDDPRIASLTKQDIDSFISNQSRTMVANTTTVNETGGVEFGARFGINVENVGEVVPDDAENQIEKAVPEAIEAMLDKDSVLDDPEKTKSRVIYDIKILQTLVHGRTEEERKIEFDLSINYQEDDKGNQLISGVTVRIGSQVISMDNNRVCPSCGRQIFDKAGTALHKSIVFIGYQGSGKTSTILSMTHYAINHMAANRGNSIWQGAEVLDCIDEVASVDRCSALQAELHEFSNGYAPTKTEVEEDRDTTKSKRGHAYTSTLFIKSHSGRKKVERLITLTDLPGELCSDGGTIKVDKLLNSYKVAAACDAFVVCFDTSKVEEMISNNEVSSERKNSDDISGNLIDDTCSWADSFQRMLVQSKNQKNYVPMMLLFTKCRQLEAMEEEISITGNNIPLKKAYVFSSEQRKIENNQIYNVVSNLFNKSDSLPKAYQAMIRCSPYGYSAPTNESANNDTHPVHKPTPHNIDKLLKWILCVSGCVPVPAKYSITTNNTYLLNDYYINRTQCRSELPEAGSGKDWEEAMARVYLFNNPGQFDEAFVKASGQKAVMIKVRVEAGLAKAKKDANLGKE